MAEREFVFRDVTVQELTTRGGVTEGRALTPPECDFCLDARVRWSYDCDPFECPEFGVASMDGWAACDRCSALVEAGQREMLYLRSTRSWRVRGLPPNETVFASIRAMHDGFFDNRRGERVAFG